MSKKSTRNIQEESEFAMGLRALRHGATKKKLRGESLSLVEQHLLDNTNALKQKLFGPSRFEVFFDVLGAVAKPAIVYFIILYAVVHLFSGNLLSSEQSEEELAESQLSEEEIIAAEELALGTADFSTENSTFHRSSFKSPSLISSNEYQQHILSFLSGVITMHLPNTENGAQIAKEIIQISEKNDVNPFLIAAVISVESRFHRRAQSKVGAMGLMQLMPSIAHELFKRNTGKKHYPALTDTKTNIELGVSYLKELEEEFKGNRFIALSAYNWGIGNIKKVAKEGGAIPGSVKRYSRTVLERSLNWERQFNRAYKIATETPPTEKLPLEKLDSAEFDEVI